MLMQVYIFARGNYITSPFINAEIKIISEVKVASVATQALYRPSSSLICKGSM